MNGQRLSTKSFGSKISGVFTAPIRYLYSLLGSLAVTMSLGIATYCTTTKLNSNMSAESIFGGIAEVIIKIAFYCGAVMAAGGVFALVVAYKDDNADSQQRAVRYLIVGILLVGFRGILELVGII